MQDLYVLFEVELSLGPVLAPVTGVVDALVLRLYMLPQVEPPLGPVAAVVTGVVAIATW